MSSRWTANNSFKFGQRASPHFRDTSKDTEISRISDGYGNSRVVKFPDRKVREQAAEKKGTERIRSPASVVIDSRGRLIVGDRECAHSDFRPGWEISRRCAGRVSENRTAFASRRTTRCMSARADGGTITIAKNGKPGDLECDQGTRPPGWIGMDPSGALHWRTCALR